MQHSFQQFQQAFGQHLRNPHHVPRPAGTSEPRVAVYRELVFNNLCGFVDSCFPVCRQLLGDARWRRLCRTFLRDWPMHTPWFREIPREFVRYLGESAISQPVPRWLPELAHYEWAELAVDVIEALRPDADPGGNLMDAQVVLNPAMMNLAYAWPVHRIGVDYRPRKPQATYLLVYRDRDDTVRFSEITPLAAYLVDLLRQDKPQTGRQALQHLAEQLAYPDLQKLLGFGAGLLGDLRRQGVILGSQP